jgi:molecular chaperone GrpE
MSDPKTDPEGAANGAPPAPPAEAERVAALEAALAAEKTALEAEKAAFAAFKDQALRQLAEAKNQQARAERDGAEARRYGAVAMARDLLAVADNIARALAALPAAQEGVADPLRQGVELIQRDLSAALERHGVKRFDPTGDKLDPHRHQAMFEVESEKPAGTVVQLVQAGYMLHDRLLRPALVGVARAKAEPPAAVPKPDGAPDPANDA